MYPCKGRIQIVRHIQKDDLIHSNDENYWAESDERKLDMMHISREQRPANSGESSQTCPSISQQSRGNIKSKRRPGLDAGNNNNHYFPPSTKSFDSPLPPIGRSHRGRLSNNMQETEGSQEGVMAKADDSDCG